ncbi:hypothetical protein CHARACLAT_029863 [Characodon lateralis]|uniref:Uncharacterized protein n=1 Tax=Characodon lateralis TaxID=208331 RepID=A0ABU7E4P7_9TELE|nr:hypothetical protein [Characodon lateralis]
MLPFVVLPAQPLRGLKQELAARTALGCQVGEPPPPLPWLLHRLKQQLSIELHVVPRADIGGQKRQKGRLQFTVQAPCLHLQKSVHCIFIHLFKKFRSTLYVT